ncbi:MAG: ATP-binding protein [Hyphomonadaceae bacterium]
MPAQVPGNGAEAGAFAPLRRVRLPAYLGPLAMGVGFLIVVALASLTLWMMDRARETSAWVDHSHSVQRAIVEVRADLQAGESARRGLLLDPDPLFEAAFREASAELPRDLGALRELVADNADQSARIEQFSTLLDRHLQAQATSVVGVRIGARAPAIQTFGEDGSSARIEALEGLLSHMARAEAAILRDRTQREAATQQSLLTVTFAAVALIALLGLVSIAAYARNAAALERSRDDLTRFNEELERAVETRTADLAQANAEIQRFAHLVSHDLRAPLVNIMGFANELKRVNADIGEKGFSDTASADIAEALQFIQASTEKMDRLISSILRMAREGRRTLTPQAVDMNALIEGSFNAVRNQAAEAQVTLQIEGELPGIVSDRLAVEQVFGNLIDNAVKYAKKDRPGRVIVRGRRAGANFEFEVQDEGVGIAPQDQQRVFDMFRRAAGADAPGEGVGLAYIRQIVRRLGGAISLQSRPGEGSIFRVTLPRTLRIEENVFE